MKFNNGRWVGRLLARTLLHALGGGVFAALVGALCIALAGALTGAVIDIGGTPYRWGESLIPIGFCFGLALGGAGGGIVGVILHALQGLFSAPDLRLLPTRAFLCRVSLGQIGATIGACASFFGFEILFSLTQSLPFPACVDRHLVWIMFGAPALMMCGAIAGALWRGESASDARHGEAKESAKPRRAALSLPKERV